MKLYSLVLLALLMTTATAQEPVPVEPAKPALEASSKPPGDPYVKKKPGESKSAAVATGAGASVGPDAPFEAPPHHLLMTFETYSLPQQALDRLFEQADADAALYDGVRKLVQTGQASLETVMALPTRSGQRASVESHDEFLYASEFQSPTNAVQYGFPTSMEIRALGDRIEVEVVESPDGAVDMNFSQDITRLVGFNVVKSGEFSEGELQPLFSSRNIQTAVVTNIGEPAFCGTLSQPHATGVAGAEGDGAVGVTFVRTDLCPTLPEAKEGKSPAKKEESDGGRNIRMVFRFYSLPREKARDLLAETTDADKLYAMVNRLPPQDMNLERLLSVITRSGQRAQATETTEWLYGIDTDPPEAWNEEKTELGEEGAGKAEPKPDAAPVAKPRLPFVPAGATSFESRPLGWQVEIDPVVGPDAQTIDVNLAPSYTQYRGPNQEHPLLALYPDMPLFSSQKILTAITATEGKQCFLGTMGPPRDTGLSGRKDDGRTWFAFMKVTIE